MKKGLFVPSKSFFYSVSIQSLSSTGSNPSTLVFKGSLKKFHEPEFLKLD